MRQQSLPKEQQSAYERWEMASLDVAVPPAAMPVAEAERSAAQQQEQQQQQQVEQLTRMRLQAQEQGQIEGQAQGLAQGLAEGRAAAAQERAVLVALATGFTHEIARANELIAADLLQLALDIARAVLKTALEVHPELVLPIVTEAIRYLPTVQQPALLALHPLDVPIVTERLGTELASAGWVLTADAHMQRGGCRVDTPAHQIDATLDGRWQRIAAALGVQSDWLAP
jgi:flagellar assembly protein FliH